MSRDVQDDLLDMKISFPRDYDWSEPVHIGTVDDDEPECHGYCHETCCSRYTPCVCKATDCEECERSTK